MSVPTQRTLLMLTIYFASRWCQRTLTVTHTLGLSLIGVLLIDPFAPLAPGAWLLHFQGGPSCATADCGFVRVSAGATFPWHAHDGDETTIVLAGAGRDSEGAVHGVGDEWVEQGGSQHDFSAELGEDYLFAVRVFGVRFDVTKPS